MTDAVTVPPAATVPREKVTTPPDTLNVPWLVVADLKLRREPRVSVRVKSSQGVFPNRPDYTLLDFEMGRFSQA